MTKEYRLVVERPEHQQGKRRFTTRKRSFEDAERALDGHRAHAEHMYEQVGLTVWEAWIEVREVSKWAELPGIVLSR